MQLNKQQRRILETIDSAADRMISVSHQIHDRPELGSSETFASGLLADTLEELGFEVERGFAGIPTAFRARKGSSRGPCVAFLAEYDALPEIGHGCGHNIIATSALTAGVGLGALIPELPGQVIVFGTPAEETDGAKVPMVNSGCFDAVDAALMIHPYNANYTHTEALAYDAIQISFYGKASHASAAPWEGKNALDGVLLTFASVNALRQQMRPDARIHGVITKGGVAPNIIPDHTEARFYVRARERGYLNLLSEQFRACARGAAEATGTRVEFVNYESGFDDIVNNTTLAERVRDYLVELGCAPFKHAPDSFGSTDMGNVSHVVPAVHLLIDITGSEPLGLHTREFAQAAAQPLADTALVRAGKGLALAGYDVLVDPAFLAAAKSEFEAMLGHAPGRLPD
ncbi:MAG: M20 family metallopeptidase [Anaerolineales bacterium]|jgi:amidohydrolase